MPTFSAVSRKRLAQAHPQLQRLMNECIKGPIDFTILDSQRGRAAQEKAFKAGNSKAHFGQSAHNWNPALALDVAPYPIDWDNRARFIQLGQQVILPTAKTLKIPVRWGGDWNMNGKITDEKFSDLPHYELTPWREYAKRSALIGS